MKGLRVMIIFLAAAMLCSCGTPSSQMSREQYWNRVCTVLHKNPASPGITREEWLAGAQDINQANQIFDQCAKNGVIGREEAEQHKELINKAISQNIMKREALRLVGPQ